MSIGILAQDQDLRIGLEVEAIEEMKTGQKWMMYVAVWTRKNQEMR